MQKWVQKKNLEESRLHTKYSKNKPFPHIVIRDFFNEREIGKVAAALLRQRFSHKETDLFSLNQTPDLSLLKDKTLRGFCQLCNSTGFLTYVSKLTGIKVRGVNMSGFIYKDGDYLLPHDDRLEGRKVAYIINLTKGYTKKNGGALALFNMKQGKPEKIVKAYVPHYNTLTLFTVSKKSFHQVNEILLSKPRLSIGGWFY